MSLKSILIILTYTISKLARFLRHSVVLFLVCHLCALFTLSSNVQLPLLQRPLTHPCNQLLFNRPILWGVDPVLWGRISGVVFRDGVLKDWPRPRGLASTSRTPRGQNFVALALASKTPGLGLGLEDPWPWPWPWPRRPLALALASTMLSSNTSLNNTPNSGLFSTFRDPWETLAMIPSP